MPLVHFFAQGHVHALRDLLDAVPSLLEAKCDGQFEGREDDGSIHNDEVPLHYACGAGSVEAARLLLDRGASVDGPMPNRRTPLMRACDSGSVEVVALLLARGADPTLRTLKGWTALTYASSAHAGLIGSDHVAVIRLLLKDGRLPVDDRSDQGRTALWQACYRGHMERARVLLVEGRADHTTADHYGTTPMAAAQQRGRHDCVQLLQWYEGELKEAGWLLSKARAVVDDTESISRAAEKAGARTEAEAQQAREEAAPVYLRGRVGRGEALPVVEVGGHVQEEWRRAVLEYVLRWLKEDLCVELMEMLRYR